MAFHKVKKYRLDSLPALEALPVTGSNGQSQILGGLADISRVDSPAVVSHYNIQPTLDLYANVQGRDLGDEMVHSTGCRRCA